MKCKNKIDKGIKCDKKFYYVPLAIDSIVLIMYMLSILELILPDA